jgi:hypothetical protein
MLNIYVGAFRICNILMLKLLLQLVSSFVSVSFVIDYCQSLCRLRKGKNSGMFGTKLNSTCDAYCSLFVRTYKRVMLIAVFLYARTNALPPTIASKCLILPRVFGSSWLGTRKLASLAEEFRGFSQFSQQNDGMVPQIMLKPLSSSFFLVY